MRQKFSQQLVRIPLVSDSPEDILLKNLFLFLSLK